MPGKRTLLFVILVVGCVSVAYVFGTVSDHVTANSYESAFAELSSPEATTNPPLQKRLIQRSFLVEPSSGVRFVLEKLWAEPGSRSFADRHNLEMGICTARAILAEMPVHIQEELASMKPGSAFRTSRLLEAMGAFRTPLALDKLKEALSDKRGSGLRMALHDGWQLRVCDVAYNTLVLRLRLSHLRSPLGSHHGYEQRDRWIQRLEDWLKENREDASLRFSSGDEPHTF